MRNAENETNLALQAFSQADYETAEQHAWKSSLFVKAAYSAEQDFRQIFRQILVIGVIAIAIVVIIVVTKKRKKKDQMVF